MLIQLFQAARKRNARLARTHDEASSIPTSPLTATHKVLSRVVAFMEVPMAVLGVGYVAVYAVAVLNPNPIVFAIDYVLWVLFAIDVVMRFLVAPSIGKFLLNNWLEILAVIIPQFRAARAIRPIVGLKRFASLVRSRSQRLAAYTVALLPLSVFVAAIAFMDVENYPAERLDDALWWAMVTVSTVGFGDVIPATDGGRIVGAALMIFGVGIFASAAAIIADWLQGEKANPN